MDATCTIQDSIHVFSLVHKYVSRILGTYQAGSTVFFIGYSFVLAILTSLQIWTNNLAVLIFFQKQRKNTSIFIRSNFNVSFLLVDNITGKIQSDPHTVNSC